VIKGFDHINMLCPNIDKGKEMYGGMFDMPVIDHSDNGTHEGYVFVAGLCDIELLATKDGNNGDRLGKGVVGSLGLWSDDVDALAKKIEHPVPPIERDLALGVPIRSISLDVGDGLPIEIAERI
jgi:catechol 2,3-dioxygenase-like lactoylglutathione lyase family enzyme